MTAAGRTVSGVLLIALAALPVSGTLAAQDCLEAEPQLLIDSRSNRDSDFHQAVAATATGAVREINSAESEDFASRFLSRHPYLEAFVRSPSCARMVLDVNTYILVSRFQNVMELHIERRRMSWA